MSVSKTILIGNLGSDPEVRFMPNGNAVCNFSLATTEKWKDKQSGQQQERTEWHRISIFGKLAEIAGQYLRKGSKVYIEGRNQTREWEKDGIKRYTTEVIVDMRGSMHMLDGKQDSNQSQPQSNNRSQQQQQQQQQRPAQQQIQQAAPPDHNTFDDNIPFANQYRGRRALLI